VYDTETFQTDLEHLLEQLKPLYQNLHTYVRRKLMDIYGEDKFPDSGHIPAHLLGLYKKMHNFVDENDVYF
jgi:peptidyl-dipeptidase A